MALLNSQFMGDYDCDSSLFSDFSSIRLNIICGVKYQKPSARGLTIRKSVKTWKLIVNYYWISIKYMYIEAFLPGLQ